MSRHSAKADAGRTGSARKALLGVALLLGLAVLVGVVSCTRGTDRAVPGPTAAPVAGTVPTGTTARPAGAPDGSTTALSTPSGTATAGLVTGFPTDVVPVPPGARVTASAVRAAGTLLEVSLSGTSSAPSEEVLAFYDKAFRARGLTPSTRGTLAPGADGRVYVRGEEVLVVAVDDADGARSFSVGGTVRT